MKYSEFVEQMLAARRIIDAPDEAEVFVQTAPDADYCVIEDLKVLVETEDGMHFVIETYNDRNVSMLRKHEPDTPSCAIDTTFMPNEVTTP
jgi:hypothetical protein